jgi:hypothetical protein
VVDAGRVHDRREGCTQALVTTALDPNGSKKVSAFLMKYHAKGGQWNCCGAPMPTVVTKESIGLVTVSGTDYYIADIGMRMLTPRERLLAPLPCLTTSPFDENESVSYRGEGRLALPGFRSPTHEAPCSALRLP